AVHDGPPDFSVEESFDFGMDPEWSSLLGRSSRLGVVGGRAHQSNAAAMPNELGQVRVIAILQGERVALAIEHNRLPPPVFTGLLGDHEMARRDVVPRLGQAAGRWQTVVVAALAQRRLWFEAKRYNDVAVQ